MSQVPTFEEAVTLCKSWSAQRISATKIVTMLAELGYVGPRTGKPIKVNMVYAMIEGDKRTKTSPQVTGVEPVKNESVLLTGLRKLLAINELSEQAKEEMVKVLVKKAG